MKRKCSICNEEDRIDDVYYRDKNGNKLEVSMCEYCLIEDSEKREGVCDKCKQIKNIFYSSIQDKGSNEWICEECLHHEMKNTMFVFKGQDGKAPTEFFFCENCGVGLKKNFCIRCGKVTDTIWISEFSDKFIKIKDKFKDIEDIDKKFSLIAENLHTDLLPAISNLVDKDDLEQDLAHKFGENLDLLTKRSIKFLTTGKFLYLAMSQNSGDFDFSPVVIEYSKALEKELYEKIFKTYRDESFDKEDKNAIFDKFLKGTIELTLGQMSYILNSIEKNSKFSNFLNKIFIDYDNYFYNYNFPKKLEKFIYKFRNKSAHIEPITKEYCEECDSYLLEEPIKLLRYLIQNLQISENKL